MRIGIDIGGTKIVGGLLDGGSRILDQFRLRSKDHHDAKDIAQSIAHQILEMLARNGLSFADVEHFGIGIPGTVDWVKGNILYSPNLFGQNVPFADMVEEALGIRPTIVQDSWAGAYAEYALGQKKRYSSMMCVTLGTGIGCGIILNGRAYGGCLGTAGEIGHVSIEKDGRPCSCGRRGCLETYVSGPAIYRQALERFPQKLTEACGSEQVFTLADAGDEQCACLLNECVDRLAFGLAGLISVVGCATIFISGGLSAHEKWMIKPLAERIRQYGYPAWSERFRPVVQRAMLGEDAPMIGAALLDGKHIRR